MELHHEFTVPVPVDDAWRALLDIERVTPCLPGATLEDYDGKTVTASVKVKVGPITVNYRGTAVFEEQDEVARRIVLIANGRETRGQGTARATIVSTLSERDDGGTAVSVHTDLTVTGRPAQFGRGVMAEVGDRLVGQFADCLAQRIAERPESAVEGESLEEPLREPLPLDQEEPEPLDLFRAAAVPLAKRAAAATAAVAVLVLVFRGVRRRRRARARRAPWRR
ncbi:SRPBCC family protein [Streptomyces sp. NPDC046805]|uniref:SRPBCC family protein n=1 Tax=Streptomyces sp. NPDC046805 TaxID=3155134 RepID=UPI0033E47714